MTTAPTTIESDHTSDFSASAAKKLPRRRVRINKGSTFHAKADRVIAAMADANEEREPEVLVRGSELARMTERGQLEPYGVDSLRDQISRVAQFFVVTENYEKDVDPPPDVATNVLTRDSAMYRELPRVDRVVDVPVVSKEGSIITESGHHADSRLYYRPASGLEHLDVEKPMAEDVEEARSLLLDDLLGDFGFADEASRAHALGLMLLPFLGEYIGANPTPLHAILAPGPGTGKTYLAQACLLPGCGRIGLMAGTDSNDEWRKRITSTLLSGRPAVVLDNLHGKLDTGALAEALTTGVWEDRILGESRNVSLPVRNVWAATGNNLDFSPEILRRTVPIFLDPGDVRPADRSRDKFRHPDLLGWADKNRRSLVWACLTLIRHWLEGEVAYLEGGYFYVRKEGGPRPGHATLGSFGNWASVVGGVLESASVEGFLGNRDRWTAEADDEAREATFFLGALRHHGPLEVRQIEPLCRFGGELYDHLPTDLAEAGPKIKGQLTRWLKAHNGTRVGGYQLVCSDGEGHNPRRRWSVLDRGAAI